MIDTVFVFVCPLAPTAVFFFFVSSYRLFAILSLNTVCTRTLYAASQTIHIVNLRRALSLYTTAVRHKPDVQQLLVVQDHTLESAPIFLVIVTLCFRSAALGWQEPTTFRLRTQP